MADREKVIKALECCSRPAIQKCKECPYESYCYHDNLCDITIHDALALLKEQEHKDRMFHALEEDWKRLKELLKEQEAEIRQLRLALDIAKGTCKWIAVETDEKFMGDL